MRDELEKNNSYHDFFQVLPCMCVFVLMYKSFFSFLTLKEFGMYNEKKNPFQTQQ